jgi:hypothetical protein
LFVEWDFVRSSATSSVIGRDGQMMGHGVEPRPGPFWDQLIDVEPGLEHGPLDHIFGEVLVAVDDG